MPQAVGSSSEEPASVPAADAGSAAERPAAAAAGWGFDAAVVRGWQPSLFGAAACDPRPGDLAGLLAASGELQRLGGTARVSVTVDAGWRVHVLVAELARRSLPASWQPVGDTGSFTVHTAYTARLVGLAQRWRAGPPAGLHLNGQAVRLWVAAAGLPSPAGFLLRLGPAGAAGAGWPVLGSALSGVGLVAALVASVPAYRITGRRRLARLAELVGDPPPAVPSQYWPAVSG